MSAFWNFVKQFVPGTLAKAEDVNTNLSGIDTGLNLIEAEINKTIQVTNETGVVDIALSAAARANKLLAFDVNGDIEAATILGDWKGDHANAAGTDYQIRDVVKDAAASLRQDSLYICINTHTSTGSLATDTANWELLVDSAESIEWAIKTDGIIDATDYSSKAYAIGGTGITSTAGKGAAKEWAITTGALVDTADYSAKEYAIGTFIPAGSAKDWASLAEDSLVDGVSYSALHHAAKAAASADFLDDRILGAFAADPTLDNDGNALLTGALYFNTAVNKMKVYNGASWQVSTAAAADVSIADTGAYYTATDVEAALAEVMTTRAPLASPDFTGQVDAPAFTEAAVTTTQSTAYACDCSSYSLFEITMTGNVAITLTNPPASGKAITITLVLIHSVAARTPTFPASVIWHQGITPNWNTVIGDEDVVTLFTYDGGTTWRGNLAGASYA